MTSVLVPVVVALVGLAVGSLVVHTAEAALAKRRLARPICPYCAQPLAPVQWSATVATITGRGRCRSCGRRLRLPRLLGELFLAAAWTMLIVTYGGTPRVLLAMLAIVPQTMIMVTDIEAKLVPNRIMLPSLGVALVLGTIFGPLVPFLDATDWWQSLAGAAVGFAVFRVLVWIGVAIFGEGALGEGDITLSAYIGAVLGFPVVLVALVLTFAFGGIGALLVLVLRRGALRTAIPYGPYIVLGCTVTLIWGGAILRWYLA